MSFISSTCTLFSVECHNFKRLELGALTGFFCRSCRASSFRVEWLAAFRAAWLSSSDARSRFLCSLTSPFRARSRLASRFLARSLSSRSFLPASVISPLSTLCSSAFLRTAFFVRRAATRSSCVNSSRPRSCRLGARNSSGAFSSASETNKGIVSSIFNDATLSSCSPLTPSMGGLGVKCAFDSRSSLCMSFTNSALVSALSLSSFTLASGVWPSISASYCCAYTSPRPTRLFSKFKVSIASASTPCGRCEGGKAVFRTTSSNISSHTR
mmetsp:Transcript_111909/g.311506  ORF Transcript_111909/g.311506 Transcript_111909/m.311506 type:complete len:269 (+) Transcript_111909:3-809(+)